MAFKEILLSLTLLFSLLFFVLQISPKSSPIPRRLLLSTSCTSPNPPSENALIDYSSLHYCVFNKNPFLSIPILSLFIVLHFYILIKTAQSHFSVVTTKLSSLLNLSPSMAAVTLLALGNGAPDVFASLHAVRTGQYRTGFSAILSAGTFVSAFVVGFVAIYAAPFAVNPAPFVRDVLFYLVGALFLFYVYLSGEIFIWQAVGFVGFYVFFVGFVFWMDLGMGREKVKSNDEREMVHVDYEVVEVSNKEEEKEAFGNQGIYGMVSSTFSAEKDPNCVLLNEDSLICCFIIDVKHFWKTRCGFSFFCK